MAQSDLYFGRGIVSLGGTDAGNVDGLTVLHQIDRFERRPFEVSAFRGGVTHVTESVRSVRVSMVFYEYQAAVLANLLRLSNNAFFEAAQSTLALTYAGVNKENSCSAVSFSAPVFLPDRPDIPLITDGMGTITVTGEILRAVGGSPEWYSLVLS